MHHKAAGNHTRGADNSNMSDAEGAVKVVYHGKNTRDNYFVMVNKNDYQKWQKDQSVPLVQVLQRVQVWKQGGMEPTRGELDSEFGTHNMDAVATMVLTAHTPSTA
eukprot:Clim_evm4s84 gene=Clim_evmTU4s84